jgi:hypothetical protein
VHCTSLRPGDRVSWRRNKLVSSVCHHDPWVDTKLDARPCQGQLKYIMLPCPGFVHRVPTGLLATRMGPWPSHYHGKLLNLQPVGTTLYDASGASMR